MIVDFLCGPGLILTVAIVVGPDPTFPLNGALDFGAQWSNGPRYTVVPYGIF